MPKINKDSLKILPRTKIWIYKFENKNTYFCRFYVGLGHKNYKSGKFEKTLKTKNINDAITKANEFYKEWFREHTDTKQQVREHDFDLDIAQPYINYKVRKYKNRTDIKNADQGVRDKSKWQYMKPMFDEVDYTDLELVEDIINNDLLSQLKDEDKSGNTINKYMSVLTQMFKRAKDRGKVSFIPDTPTQQVINTPRYPYENQELNFINERCRELNIKEIDDFHLHSKDYYNLCRSAGFRPGNEPLSLRRKDCEIISSPNNPNDKKLKFTIYNTKTEPYHYPIANDWFLKHIYSEINERHKEYQNDHDYLLFPHIKNRRTLQHKTGKLFTSISKDLNLFYHKGGTRPLYAIRHTYATEQYKQGTIIDDIATLMNTSPRMVLNVYLGHTDQSLINLANRRGNNFKVVK